MPLTCIDVATGGDGSTREPVGKKFFVLVFLSQNLAKLSPMTRAASTIVNIYRTIISAFMQVFYFLHQHLIFYAS